VRHTQEVGHEGLREKKNIISQLSTLHIGEREILRSPSIADADFITNITAVR